MHIKITRNKSQILFIGIRVYVLFCISLGMVTCFKNPDSPQLTSEIMGFSYNEITFRTNITSDGGSDIFQKGVCWANHNNPSLADNFSNDGSGNKGYVTVLSGLEGTNYYLRSYAINGAGAGYGAEVSISYVNIGTGYGEIKGTSAVFSVNLVTNGEVLSRGICWSTSTNPTINDSKTDEGTGTGSFTSTITGLIPGTAYYARAYASNASGVFYGENISFTTKDYPTVTTKEIMNIGSFIITCGGIIVNNGGAIVTGVGICWSTSQYPTTEDQKTEGNPNHQSFDSDLYGLQPDTTYYIRAYATNLVGTGYGNERSITLPQAAVYDVDGNPYSSVTIGSQIWTVENLKTTRYANGDPVVNITDQSEWINTTSGAWCYYNNNAQHEVPYGKLYNWFAVSDSRNICPNGWHAPSDAEWTTLVDFLGGSGVAGGKLKESGTAHWWSPNSTNSSGFTALPGAGIITLPGHLMVIGTSGEFWTTSAYDSENAFCYSLADYSIGINRGSLSKRSGFSVRCIKDN